MTSFVDSSAGTVATTRSAIEVAAPPRRSEWSPRTVTGFRNVRMMHQLERIAAAFEEAGIPLMALKGAALNIVLPLAPDDRPMSDLDLMVRREDLEGVHEIMERLGGLRSPVLFREDFFPRFHYEMQYRVGRVHPVTIDLHVRPLRPLRVAQLAPGDAFWQRAEACTIGSARILVPGAEDMLVHLAAHMAFHGEPRERWCNDVRTWLEVFGARIDWPRLLESVEHDGLALAFRRGMEMAGLSGTLPVAARRLRTSWRDRLALWHAPLDGRHLFRSALVNVLTTPGWRFRLDYALAVLWPNRPYMEQWRLRHGCRGRHASVFARCVWPLVQRGLRVDRLWKRVAVRRSDVHGHGVFAVRDITVGDVIARYRGRPIDRNGTYVAYHAEADGEETRHEITGELRFLNHSCRPNAELRTFRLTALRPIPKGQEILIDYGDGACTCTRDAPETEGAEG